MATKAGRSGWGQAELLTGLTKQMPSVLQQEVGEEAGLEERLKHWPTGHCESARDFQCVAVLRQPLYLVLAILVLSLYPRPASNSQRSSCLIFLSAGFKVHYNTEFS